MSRHVLVVGGGPAGIEAARAARSAGAEVTLVSEGPVGGRAGWHSLLPSKVWLTAADSAGLLSDFPTPDGRSVGRPAAVEIVARIQAVKESWNRRLADDLQARGVKIVTGVASFEGNSQVVVKNGDGQVTARRQGEAVIVATGSVPFFPPNLRPDGERILAPRFAGKLNPLPESVVVIGAGATGSEFTYLFNRLGVQVTWIVDPYGVLPAFAPQAGQFLADILARRGVHIVRDQFAERIEKTDDGVVVVTSAGERYAAAVAFVAIGRRPDLDRLNLSAAGLVLAEKQLPQVDEFGRTEVPGLYIVGDASGPPMVANKAMAQAWVAGLHAAGGTPPPFHAPSVVAAIYTDPQVAQVGTIAGNGVQTVRIPFADSLKTHLLPEMDGFVELAYDPQRRVAGGVAVGPHAADVLTPVALAVRHGLTVEELAALFPAHPSVSELVFTAARSAGW